MIISDKIVRSLETVLQKHIRASVTRNISGTPVTIRPVYIGTHFRSRTLKSQVWINGKKTSMPDLDSSQCLRVRVYAGEGKLGYGVHESGLNGITDDPAAIKAVLDASMDQFVKTAAAKYLAGIGESILTTQTSLEQNGTRVKTTYREQEELSKTDLRDISDIILKLSKDLNAKDRVVNTTIAVKDGGSAYVDTLGSDIRQQERMILVSFSLSGYDKRSRPLNISEGLSFRKPEQVTEKVVLSKITRMNRLWQAAQEKERISSGTYPILLNGGAVGTLFHEAIAAHLLSGAYVCNGDSFVYTPERMETQVLPPEITIIDDPTIPDLMGSYMYDEQGIRSQQVVLVKDGILQNYLLDIASAAALSQYVGREFHSNGRARSQWISEEGEMLKLEPRVTNLEIKINPTHLLGKQALEEAFLETIRQHPSQSGIYIENGGGEVGIEDGAFSLQPGAAWMVTSEGEKKLLQDILVVAYTDSLFSNVVAYGEPYRSGYGHCGAVSGYVPTQERAPGMLLKEATIISEPKDTRTERLITNSI